MMRDGVSLPRVPPDPDEYLNAEAIEQLKGSWPMDIIGDQSKWPRMVYSKVDFMYELINSSHLDECWVIPDGIRKLGLEGSIPYDITQRLHSYDNAYDLVKSFTPHMMDKYNARFCYAEKGGNKIQKEVDGCSIRDKIHYLETGFEDNKHTIDKDSVYMTELRYKDAYPHPISGEIVKTVSRLDIKDIAESIRPKPADRMYMYWDRYDEGLFIGGKNSGKCLHVDQCLWSNIGKNYTGWKLLALWSVADSNDVLDKLGRQTFEPPLTIGEISALKKACRIVLIRPDRLDFVLDREEREAAAASTIGGQHTHYTQITTPLDDDEEEEEAADVRDIGVYDDFEGHHYHHYGAAMDTACRHIAAAVGCVTRKRKYFRKELRKTKRLRAFVKDEEYQMH
ncbi:hypothetical protein FOL47_008279 [Perkinsus chesapeaki]|uniref:Uncharacterized protein n=1 Tax=Perkinsus chesapeaki TaxID=330153 RepID=A0A7J6MUA7_PERCH|nr:hypothetical protein FOL47_008279 [Perkinsus chesapeaki]